MASILVTSLCFPLFTVSAISFAQAPSQTVDPVGNARPDQLSYSLSASELGLFSFNGSGASTTTTVSGAASYVLGSETHPVSFVYAGGYFAGNGEPSSTFQNLAVSQVLKGRKWVFVATDSVNFLPNAPAYGVSGVPGVGDTGSTPITTTGLPADSILTNYGRLLTQTSAGSLTYQLSSRTGVSGSGSYSIERFFDNTGIENNELSADFGMDHRLTTRTDLGFDYTYLDFIYPSYAFSYTVNGVGATYQHSFTRLLRATASGGPQWINIDQSGQISQEVEVSANATLVYGRERTSASLTYERGANAGTGVLLGSYADNLNFNAQRHFTYLWQGSFTADYGRANSLIQYAGQTLTTKSFYMGVQANRMLGRNASAYASYNFQIQSLSQGGVVANAFLGQAHVLGFGITLTPRPIQFKRK